MADKINLKGLNKADILAILYNASKPQGMGFLHYDPKPMTREEAQELLNKTQCFDYLKGRVMKINLSGDELDIWSYDRDNGEGAAERAIATLRSPTNPNLVQITHNYNTKKEAERLKEEMKEMKEDKTYTQPGVIHLGLDDVADVLTPAIDRAIKKLDDLNKQ